MIDLYIAATRAVKAEEEVSPQLLRLYSEVAVFAADQLSKMGSQHAPWIRFRAVYSWQLSAETVTFEGQRYVIYDQYLGQVLNRLNRLILDKAHPLRVMAYLYKLNAVQLLAEGNVRFALDYSIIYNRYREDNQPKESSPAEQRMRAEITLVQEAMVIAHEYMHHILAESSQFGRALKDSYAANLVAASRVVNPFQAKANMEQNVEGLVEVERQDLGDLYSTLYGKPLPPDQSEKFINEFEAGILKSTDGEPYLERVLGDSWLLEECICDAVACDLAARYVANKPGSDINYRKGLLHAFRGLHLLRLIRMNSLQHSLYGPYGAIVNIPDGKEKSQFVLAAQDAVYRFQAARIYITMLAAADSEGFNHARPHFDVSASSTDPDIWYELFQDATSIVNREYHRLIGDVADGPHFFEAAGMIEDLHARQEYESIRQLPLEQALVLARTLCELSAPSDTIDR